MQTSTDPVSRLLERLCSPPNRSQRHEKGRKVSGGRELIAESRQHGGVVGREDY